MANVINVKCPSCKASIVYNPSLGKFKCDYCRSEFTIDEINKSQDQIYKKENEAVEEKSTTVEEKDPGLVTYKCSNCGAEIIADANTASTFCIYCRHTSILRNKMEGKFRPSKIIPFKIEKNAAVAAFQNLSKGRPLMPRLFNDKENIEKITPVYIPFWLYEAEVTGELEGTGTRVSSYVVGDTHYTKTSYYNIARAGTVTFKNIPVDGSKRFDNSMMNALEPFDFNYLVDYSHAYLSGYLTEKFDVDKDEAFADAKSRSTKSATDIMSNDMVYTSKIYKTNTLASKYTKADYVLLPVYMINIKYGGKMHLFAMNGQTGELIGDIPVSTPRSIVYFLIVFAIAFVITMAVMYLIYLKG